MQSREEISGTGIASVKTMHLKGINNAVAIYFSLDYNKPHLL